MRPRRGIAAAASFRLFALYTSRYPHEFLAPLLPVRMEGASNPAFRQFSSYAPTIAHVTTLCASGALSTHWRMARAHARGHDRRLLGLSQHS